MKSNKVRSASLSLMLLSIVFLSLFSYAKKHEHHQEHHNNLNSHVHGLSEITIAIDGNIVEMNFISPAANLIGFEHKATSKKEISIVNEAKALLEEATLLFSFKEGSCKIIDKNADVSALIKLDEHDEKHVNHSDHSQMIAHYRYKCEDVSQLSEIQVKVFSQFSDIHKINAMWITQTGQGSAVLNAKNKTIYLHY